MYEDFRDKITFFVTIYCVFKTRFVLSLSYGTSLPSSQNPSTILQAGNGREGETSQLNSTRLDEERDGIRVIAGYQQPKCKRHLASDDDTLRRLLNSDGNIGCAISNSDYLHDLTIFVGLSELGLQSFFSCLADNWSFVQLTIVKFQSDFDHFVLPCPPLRAQLQPLQH